MDYQKMTYSGISRGSSDCSCPFPVSSTLIFLRGAARLSELTSGSAGFDGNKLNVSRVWIYTVAQVGWIRAQDYCQMDRPAPVMIRASLEAAYHLETPTAGIVGWGQYLLLQRAGAAPGDTPESFPPQLPCTETRVAISAAHFSRARRGPCSIHVSSTSGYRGSLCTGATKEPKLKSPSTPVYGYETGKVMISQEPPTPRHDGMQCFTNHQAPPYALEVAPPHRAPVKHGPALAN
ncbi:hypothetical protein V8C42DRAFT_80985 [Trichoderma barbatum]